MVNRILLLLFAFALSKVASAQHKKEFFDAFGKRGEIVAASPILDTVLPLSGLYELRWRTIDSMNLQTSFVKGKLKNHKPDGVWTWEEGNWSYSILPGASIRPVFSSSGCRTRWHVNFKNGLINGQYKVVVDSVFSDGKTRSPLLNFEVNIINGVPTGNFTVKQQLENVTYQIRGAFNKSGVAHGVWTYEFINNKKASVHEEHLYSDGLLTDVWVTENGKRLHKPFLLNTNFLAGKLRNETRIGTHRFEHSEYASFDADRTEEIFQKFFGMGWSHPLFYFDLYRQFPAFLQLEFPLSYNELASKNHAKHKVDDLQRLLNEIMGLNLLIIRNRGEDHDLAVSYIESTHSRLKVIDSLLLRAELPLFTYKNRHELGLSKWCDYIDLDLIIAGEIFPNISGQLPAIGDLDGEMSVFEKINQLMNITEAELLLKIQQILNAEVELQKEGELRDLENKLVHGYEKLQEIYMDVQGFARFLAVKWVKEDLPQMLQVYAKTNNYEQALNLADELNNRMDSLIMMHEYAPLIDSMVILLDQHYRFMDYNPFSGSYDIEIRVKRKFLTNIIQLLWPMMMDELQSAQDWKSFTVLYDRQIRTFNFLMSFAFLEDKQANRINKRIRKEKKAERIWKILEPLVYQN